MRKIICAIFLCSIIILVVISCKIKKEVSIDELNNINDDECIFCQVENSRCYKLMQKIKLTLRDQIPQFKNILKSYLQHAVILKKINDESKLDKNQMIIKI